ncbi:MAG TPA: hypothetical protein VFM18_18185 [Methanosarcina sp.]|nr:hypothetical protein [Methanosarcina sp.]
MRLFADFIFACVFFALYYIICEPQTWTDWLPGYVLLIATDFIHGIIARKMGYYADEPTDE